MQLNMVDVGEPQTSNLELRTAYILLCNSYPELIPPHSSLLSNP